MEIAGRQARLRSKTGDLTECMDACVCAARPLQQDFLLGQLAKNAHDLALNGRFAGLSLPAVKIGAVVGDGQLEIAHAGRVRRGFATRPLTSRSGRNGSQVSWRRCPHDIAGNLRGYSWRSAN